LLDINGWFVRYDSPFQTAEEVVQWIIDNPGRLTVGMAGASEANNMMITEALSAELDGQIAFTVLGFEGASRAATELIGGHIMVAQGKIADYITHMNSGLIRPRRNPRADDDHGRSPPGAAYVYI